MSKHYDTNLVAVSYSWEPGHDEEDADLCQHVLRLTVIGSPDDAD